MVLEGELSICLVAAKQPSNTDHVKKALQLTCSRCFFGFTKKRSLSSEDPLPTLDIFWERWNPSTPSWTRFLNGLAHNRSNVSGIQPEIEGVHTHFSRSIFPFMSTKIMRAAVQTDFECESWSIMWDKQNNVFAGICQRGADIFPQITIFLTKGFCPFRTSS